MKVKLYTLGQNVNTLKKIYNKGGIFTAEEHAYAVKQDYGETVFKTKNNLISEWLSTNHKKLDCLSFLIDHIKHSGHKNILSLGAGYCVFEYFLKMGLPEKSKLIASDFDGFIIEKIKEFFPEIIAENFDFCEDDIRSLQSKLNIEFDLVIFLGSAYVMDDQEFIKLLCDLKKIGVKQIINFHAGYLDAKLIMFQYLNFLKKNPTIRKWFRKPPSTFGGYPAKHHGYGRSRGAIKKLYNSSGFSIKEECSVGGYRYVSVLE